MNNTKNILVVAIITATLIIGTSVIPMQSYAGENKNAKDLSLQSRQALYQTKRAQPTLRPGQLCVQER